MTKPALFLDRDGVINVDHGYVHKVEEFEFVDGIFELVAAAQKAGYLVVVVTNQAGIGRGYYTEADFHLLMDWVRAEFVARGGQIDAVYFCPFHPEHGLGDYRQDSEFRKPAPGMLLQAARELGIDLGDSIFVGDNLTDMQAGLGAGVGSLLYLTEKSDQDLGVRISHLAEVLPHLKSRNR
jgi:D-glycero-D-manno-heptose 1,7-bisphosphate phosphatase